jgi:hypothetical protein
MPRHATAVAVHRLARRLALDVRASQHAARRRVCLGCRAVRHHSFLVRFGRGCRLAREGTAADRPFMTQE